MTKPRVVELTYRINARALEVAAPIAFENELGAFALDGDRLRVRPCVEYKSVESASAAIEPLLRAWELQAELLDGVSGFRFALDDVELVGTSSYRAPPKLTGTTDGPSEGECEDLVIVSRWHPTRPMMRLTSDLLVMVERFRRASSGIGEPLQASAYYCLTVLERVAGGRAEAASLFRVNKDVLRKLGELTTIHGSPLDARKAIPRHGRPLSSREASWIRLAVRGLLLQFGAHAAGAVPKELTMDSLPPLTQLGA